LSPRIWVSTAALERLGPAELDAVLRHERFHLRHRDPLRIVIARVLAAALFAVPVMRARCLRFEVAKELDADLEAVAALGARAVAGALVALDGEGTQSPAAIGAWSLAGLRIDQLELAGGADLLPRAAPAARWLSTAMLALALALASGQAIRANLVPASFFTAIGMPSTAASVHECPLPMEGVLF